jgi:hypothetical protein
MTYVKVERGPPDAIEIGMKTQNMAAKQALLIAILVLSTVSVMNAQLQRNLEDGVPTGKGFAVAGDMPRVISLGAVKGSSAASNNGIVYHGGPVISGNVNIYFIWYGNWSNGPKSSDSQITQALLEELYARYGGMGSSTGYSQVATTYTGQSRTAAGSFYLVQSTTDNYSKGKSLTDATLKTVVTNAIQSGKLPKDANGLYFVLTSSDVNETSGFCNKYCGFHDHTTFLKTDIRYSFIGNPDRCAASCETQIQSPNGDAAADAMASTMAHETIESITDPALNAWYDTKGQEVGDKCAWKWGTLQGELGYGAYNHTFSSRNWLIQMTWENTRGGGCVQNKGQAFSTR